MNWRISIFFAPFQTMYILITCLIIGSSCEKNDQNMPNGYQNISSPTVGLEKSALTSNSLSVDLKGIIFDKGNVNILETGFVWADFPDSKLGESLKYIEKDSTKVRSFSFTLENLLPDRIYYFKAYARTRLDTFYSNELIHNTNRWVRIASFLAGEISSMFGFVSSSGRVFAGGGINNRSFYEYLIDENQWIKKADFPGGNLVDAVGFSPNPTKGFVVTGSKTIEVWEYDISNNRWTRKKNDFPGVARQGAIGFFDNFDLYFGLGEDLDGKVLKDFWLYDYTKDKWTQLDDFPGESRRNAIAFSFNSDGVVGLGEGEGNYYSDFWLYDSFLEEWEPLPVFPGAARSAAVGFETRNGAVVGGGKNNNGPILDFWQLIDDPREPKWAKVTSFNGKAVVSALGISSWSESTGFVIGGLNSSDCWKFIDN